MSGSTHLLSHISWWCEQGKLYSLFSENWSHIISLYILSGVWVAELVVGFQILAGRGIYFIHNFDSKFGCDTEHHV
jgi:hypothetical protein